MIELIAKILGTWVILGFVVGGLMCMAPDYSKVKTIGILAVMSACLIVLSTLVGIVLWDVWR